MWHGECQYRMRAKAGDSCRCLIGLLIPDDKYNSTVEGRPVSELLVEFPNVFDADSPMLKVKVGFLTCAQYDLHDGWAEGEVMAGGVRDMAKRIKSYAQFADRYKLKFDIKRAVMELL